MRTPFPITYKNVKACPVINQNQVMEWSITREGVFCAKIPDSLFQQEKDDIMSAFSEHRPWVPGSSQPKVDAEGRAMTLRTAQTLLPFTCMDGADLTYEVDEHTRFLLGREIARGGQISDACKAIPAEQWAGFVRELFARIIGDPAPLDTASLGTEWIKMVHDKAEEFPEWDNLRQLGAGDEWGAGLGAAIMARKLADRFKSELEKLTFTDPAKLEANAQVTKEIAGTSEGAKLAIGRARAAAKAAKAAASACALAIEVSESLGGVIREAVKSATSEISETLVAMSSLGCGGEPGHASIVTGPRRELVEAFLRDDKLRRVAELAGRLRVAARAAQKAKVRYLPEQITSVTLGGEIARLLPSELALLALEETEVLALRRIVEREALQYEMRGREAVDRGPLILCVDESGSMNGAKHELAMATGLALIEIAAMQRRPFALVHFDSRVSNTWVVEKPREIPMDVLAKQVAMFSGGGTDFEPPLQNSAHLIEAVSAMRESDVVLLTDGAASWQAGPERLAKLGARLWGIEIGGQFSSKQRSKMAGVATLNPDLSGSVKKLDLVLGI